MMKIKIIKQQPVYPSKYSIPDSWNFPEKEEIEIQCSGSGTKTDPLIINDSIGIPKRTTIKNSKYHIIIKNLKLKKLYLERCRNISLENCEIDLFRMSSCLEINVKNLLNSKDLRLKECQNITFEKCFIRSVILFKSNNNGFKESFIVRLKDWMSNTNNYDRINLKKLETNVKRETFNKRNTVKNTEVVKAIYKMRKLWHTGPKAMLKDKMCLSAIIFLIFFTVCLIISMNQYKMSQDPGYWYIIGILSIPIYMIGLPLYVYLSELYFKLMLKIKSKK